MSREILRYNPKLKEVARKLRNRSTHSEALLWEHLKGRQMLGYDFHRQKPIDQFIVDFFCNELMLAIEIDGVTHDYKVGTDEARQRKLESLGVSFLRFLDRDVISNTDGVVSSMKSWIEENTPRPFGAPLSRGERDGQGPFHLS